jgi:hypothetical protein
LAINSFSKRASLKDGLRRPRPLSWNLLRKPTEALKKRSMSVQLPKDVSSSTMTRSVISAPILTSTTNAKVAEAEGVYCGELTQETCDKSTWSSKVGWIPDDQAAAQEARTLADKIRQEATNLEKPEGRLQKLAHTLLRRPKPEDPLRVDRNSSLNHKIVRRRAETVNLCKEKIKDLTGNGLVRRKSIDPKRDRQDPESPPLLRKTFQAGLASNEDGDSQYGSLTRSFNSALEKLDLPAASNKSLLPSRIPVFNVQNGMSMTVSGLQTDGDKDDNANRIGRKMDVHQYHFSGNEGYLPSGPVLGYPGGINPLRMHTSVTAFATAPQATPIASTAQATRPSSDVDNCSLDEAPIFSPSMGNLSQYSNTPAAKTTSTPATTPTRPPLLKKSKSGLGLSGRSTLARGDENQPLKKSRSMSLNPFRKETPPPVSGRDSPYKPATPSPLRNEAKLVKGRNARAGTLRRSPQDRAKRFGTIGLPGQEMQQ